MSIVCLINLYIYLKYKFENGLLESQGKLVPDPHRRGTVCRDQQVYIWCYWHW